MIRALGRPLHFALRAALAGLLALLALACLAVAAAWWWAGQDGALQWAVEQAHKAAEGRLEIQGARGSLRGVVEIDRLAWRDGDLRIELYDAAFDLDWLAAARAALGFEFLKARRVEIALPPGDGKPAKPPSAFGVPFPLRVQRAEVGQFTLLDAAERYELRDAAFAYAGGAAMHRVRELKAQFSWREWRAGVALDGSLGALPPFALEAALALDLAEPRAEVRSRWSGSLERPRASAEIGFAGARAKASASLAPFADRRLESLHLEASGVDIAAVAAALRRETALPHTAASFDLRGAQTAKGTIAGTLSLVNARPGPIDRDLVPVARLEARFETDFASARFSGLRAALAPRGSLAGDAQLGRKGATLELQTREVTLRAFHSTLRDTDLSGPVELDLDGERQTARATLEQADMRLALDATRAGERIDVRSFRAQARGGEASGSGIVRLGKASGFDASIALARFDPAQWGDYPEGNINGTALVEGRLGPARRISARWNIAASTLFGRPLASAGRADVLGEFPALRIAQADASLALAGNRVDARGNFGRAGDVLGWKLDVPKLEELPDTPWTAGLRAGGSLRGEGTLGGGFASWRVTFSAQGANLAGPGGVAARALTAKGSAGSAREDPFEVALEARELALPGFGMRRLAARSSGTLSRHELRLAVANELLDLDARLEGGLDKDLWRGRLMTMVNRGQYPLDLVAPTPLELGAQRVHIGRLQATLGEGHLLLREASWQPGRLSSNGQFEDVPAAWALVPLGLAQPRTTLALSGEWALDSTPKLNGHLTLRRSRGDVFLEAAGMDLGLQRAAVIARFKEGRLAADASLASRVATLEGSAQTEPEPGAEGLGFTPASPLALQARVEVADVRPLLASVQMQGRVSGRALAVLRGSGTLGKPVLTGSVNADALGFDLPPWGMYLKDGRLRAELQGDMLQVNEFSLRGGEGRFVASGALPLRFADGGTKLDWRAEDLTLLNRPDMRLALGGRGTASFDGKRFGLQGELVATRGEFEIEQNRLPGLADDIVVVGRPAPKPKGRVRLPLDVDLQANLGENFFLRAWGFAGRLTGQVHFTTDAAGELRAQGKLESVNATFQAYGQRLQVQHGFAFFTGPLDNPALQVSAWRRNQPVEAGVQLTGPVKDPRVTLVSEPPVPEGERLSWLVLGRGPGDAAGADIAMLQAAAGALLGRRNSPSPTQRIASAFGLDELTVRSSSSLPSQVVAVGKRLSDRLYISYEQAVGVAAASLVKLDFSLTRRLSLRAETGTSSGLGVVYRYSWD